MFVRRCLPLTLVVLLLLPAGVAPAYPRPGRVELVTVAIQGEPDSYSHEPRLSADGRYVAFQSDSTNLVPGDTNAMTDVFVRDLHTGVTRRASTTSDGDQANLNSAAPSLSADGRYVAFSSRATDLVPGDLNGAWDIFVKDLESGAIQIASLASDGSQANGLSASPSLEAMAAGLVAFESDASNLVAGDTNGLRDVFVRDLVRRTTVRVSVGPDGTEGGGVSTSISMSADGRLAAFGSTATNFVPGDTNGRGDVFVKELSTGAVRRISVSSAGEEANQGGGAPILAGDGTLVAFSSAASNLVPADTNAGTNQFGIADMFVHDLRSGRTERVSVSSTGGEGNGVSGLAGMSSDGRYVTFQSGASNLVAGDTNRTPDVFVHDRLMGTTERISLRHDGGEATGGLFGCSRAVPSLDGSVVAFACDHPSIVPGDTGTGFDSDIFVRHRGPAVGIVDASANTDEDGMSIAGSATFSGEVVAAAADLPTDGVEDLGTELTAASIAHRPEEEDLLVRIAVARLPGVRGNNVPPFQPGTVVPGTAGAPVVIHGLRFTAASNAYELRILRLGAAAAPPAAPLFALHRCEATCLEVARLAGGYGTTGEEVRAAIPLASLPGAAELRDLMVFAGVGEGAAGAIHVVDEVVLPNAMIASPTVELAVAAPGDDPSFAAQASLAAGRFSGRVEGRGVPWVRACLGETCSSRAIPSPRPTVP